MAREVFSKLITSVNPKVMNASSRNGIKIDRIILHHNASTNKNVAMNTWVQGGPAGTSAHYEVTPTEIIGCVGEQYAAWHAGGTGGSDVPRISNPNQRSIGIENLNSSGAPYWKVDPRTMRNCARLVADICKRYNIPLDRKHVLGHKEVTATACPGGLNVDEVVRLAKGAKGVMITKPTYFKWRPVWIYTKKNVKAYRTAKEVGSGKNAVETYGKHSKLKTKRLDGKRFELTNGLYITANKAYVNNLYYTLRSKVKIVESVKGSATYKDVSLTKKVESFKKGTQFSVYKMVKDEKHNVTRIKLKNGRYISANKLINKFVE
ncbi:N-acetylmuramoyl-L-alanine amidase [Lentilactobacillus sp. Marseille-Q4993]|uniref:N-acetylmuramoyl-L-alanine amidase n=1 Tax=Lentilactobacillus sp. Marseille-Q4993 TaxID=3039492 RepID=UPI0024BC451E|nr:N-acetylmuramoyl-L-alanine amidase [Lentilactobacillus sp. Marseille-Q4993]